MNRRGAQSHDHHAIPFKIIIFFPVSDRCTNKFFSAICKSHTVSHNAPQRLKSGEAYADRNLVPSLLPRAPKEPSTLDNPTIATRMEWSRVSHTLPRAEEGPSTLALVCVFAPPASPAPSLLPQCPLLGLKLYQAHCFSLNL